MIAYKTALSNQDLKGILQLQKANLPINVMREKMASQGFVTLVHSLADLQKLNEVEQHIIAKDEETIIGYLVAMTARSKKDIAVLKPMFESFDDVVYNSKPVSACNYIVVGQVCVDKAYRGREILDTCYAAYKEAYSNKYDFAITEIGTKSTRSLNAHKRIGFETLHTYTAADGVEWSIVIWKW